jgi:hypothetical protein
MKEELEGWSRTYNGWEVEVTLKFGLKTFVSNDTTAILWA